MFVLSYTKNKKIIIMFSTDEMTSFFEKMYRYRKFGLNKAFKLLRVLFRCTSSR